jgi:outer membrane protein assembly factor BamB
MRPVSSITDAEMASVISYLALTSASGGRGGRGFGRGGGSPIELPPGPVVARGGAPQPPLPPRSLGPFYPGVGGNAGNAPYPPDVKGPLPETRYMTDYGVLASFTKPPYTTLTAYDLNTGEIRWRVPHGSVAAPAELGIPPDTGAHWPRGGLLLTGGGLLFAASGSDKSLRAYDRRTGRVVWTHALPAASDGVPASYEAGGRQFIVVPVAAGHGWNPARFPTLPPPPEGAYVAFALRP